MEAPVVAMEVRHPGDGVAVIDITGAVTAACEKVLTAAYEEASSPGTRDIVLNFSGLEYMNSGGIGMLVTMLVRANRQHQQLAAVGLSHHYREILELTRLDEAIAVHDSEPEALSALRSGHGRVTR
jgi:anti-sigma B factor antagonist